MIYEKHFTGEDFDSIWTYDTEISKSNPISVVNKWKKTQKQLEGQNVENAIARNDV